MAQAKPKRPAFKSCARVADDQRMRRGGLQNLQTWRDARRQHHITDRQVMQRLQTWTEYRGRSGYSLMPYSLILYWRARRLMPSNFAAFSRWLVTSANVR